MNRKSSGRKHSQQVTLVTVGSQGFSSANLGQVLILREREHLPITCITALNRIRKAMERSTN